MFQEFIVVASSALLSLFISILSGLPLDLITRNASAKATCGLSQVLIFPDPAAQFHGQTSAR